MFLFYLVSIPTRTYGSLKIAVFWDMALYIQLNFIDISEE
jgi:hypothetical protein